MKGFRTYEFASPNELKKLEPTTLKSFKLETQSPPISAVLTSVKARNVEYKDTIITTAIDTNTRYAHLTT